MSIASSSSIRSDSQSDATSWNMERGELVISSAKGTWRFEEAGEIAWRRVPEGNNPLWLVRQTDVIAPEGDGE